TGTDKYNIFPNIDPLHPGQGYWTSFTAPTAVRIDGKLLTQEPFFSTGLTFGWNQIGNPYLTAIPISTLQFQYQADNVPQDLAGAIGKGWIASTTLPTLGNV